MPIPAGFVATPAGYYTRVSDAAGPFTCDGASMAFVGPAPIVALSSGNVANAAAVATIGPSSGDLSFMTGFEVTGTGATAASVVLVTVTGGLGGTLTYVLAIPAGVTTPIQPLVVQFDPPIRSSTTSTALVVTAPAFGAGNTNAAVVARGYVL